MEPTAKKSSSNVVRLHTKQAYAYECDRRVVIACSGIQGGKSFVGALRLRKEVKVKWPANKFPGVNFAVTAPDYKIMKQSTRDAFDRVFNGMGKMQEQDQVFTLYDKRKIFFRTMVKNPNSVEGIPNCVFIWGDEAGLYPLTSYRNIVSRTGLMQGSAFFTSTPYAMNWMAKEIKKFHEGSPDIGYFEWESIDNPAFPREEYELQRRILPPKVFNRRYRGIHETMEGLIFEYADRHKVDPFPISAFDCYGGIDWGWDHPAGIVVRCVPNNGKSYTVSIMKRSGLSVSQMMEVIAAKTKTFHVKRWFCDPSRPELIAELNNRGIPAVKFYDEAPEFREVKAGAQLHAELMNSGKYYVFKELDQLEDLEDEYATYRWNKEETEEYGRKEEPIKVNDDLMDAERMVSVGIRFYVQDKKVVSKIPHTLVHRIDNWRPGPEDESKESPEDY
jgi:hypothetical protein